MEKLVTLVTYFYLTYIALVWHLLTSVNEVCTNFVMTLYGSVLFKQ